MKRLLIISMLALLGMTQAVAQEYEYVPFVREGVKWVYRVHNDSWTPNPALPAGTFYFNLEFKGDTIINGKTYKAMHKYFGDAINEENDTVPIYMREEDKVVYGIIPDGRRYTDCPVGRVGKRYTPCHIRALYQQPDRHCSKGQFHDGQHERKDPCHALHHGSAGSFEQQPASGRASRQCDPPCRGHDGMFYLSL